MATFEPADPELTRLLENGGQYRLDELREDYHGPDFAAEIVQLVERGEVALLPIGEHVCVKRQR